SLSPSAVDSTAAPVPPSPPPTVNVAAATSAPRPKLTPLSPGRVGLQLTISQETYDMIVRAKELMSHANPSGDLETVITRALKALIPQLEKQKFAATEKPR